MQGLIVRKVLSLGAVLAAVGTLVAGPRVTVIGDSISAYGGTSIYAGYYPAHGVDSVDKMWWKIAINAIGGELACDAAWSGTAVAGTGTSPMSSDHRLSKDRLGENPDLFLIFAGTNDGRGGVELGEFTYDFHATVDRTKFRPAFAYMLNWLKTNYPRAKILVVVNTDVDRLLGTTDEQWEPYATSMETIAAHYGIASMRIHDVAKGIESYAQSPSGQVQVHPTAAGMVTFGNQVAAACQQLLARSVPPRAELSVSAGAPGSLNVSCRLTDAGVDAETVTVSVGALPKGHEPSTIPVGAPVGVLTADNDEWKGSVSGLVPGYDYTVRVRLVNDREAESNLFADCKVAVKGVAFSYTGDSSVTYFADGRTAITLTSSGTLTLDSAATLNDLLVVGGGGGGGGNLGGGGGAGGVVMKSGIDTLIAAGPYEVVIGEGGTGGNVGKGGVGGDTSVALGTIAETAPGGGGGATYGNGAGLDGGCGGGGSHGGAGGSATFDDEAAGHFGKSGGSSKSLATGGGGGATQAGGDGGKGIGGDGISCDFTGAPVVYAGGGGGGSTTPAIGGAGGLGGGGTGQALNNNTDGEPGTDGLGGGGGGGSGSFANGNGGNGGSGCVVLRLTAIEVFRLTRYYYFEGDRRLVVDFAGASMEDPTADIDLYWTAGDYTSDYSGWTKVPSVGTCADASASVIVDASARYLVFAVGSDYSRPLIVSELPHGSELTEITATLTLAQLPGGLQVQSSVEGAGFEATTLAASFGMRAKGLCDPSEIPLVSIASDWQKGTVWSNDVTGLVRGETYTVRLHLENDQGEVKDVFVEGRVETAGDDRLSFSYTGDSSVTYFADGRAAIALTSSGTLTLDSAAKLNDLLVVGGGGAGGGNIGGGGGGGGVVMKSGIDTLIAAGPYGVVIGEGGTGGTGKGGVGGDTSVALGTIAETAPGGGGGATYGSNVGLNGGSGGGGAGGGYGGGSGAGGSATFDDEDSGHYGKSGGNGVGGYFSGGGGGAAQAGAAAASSRPGAGGNGIPCDFFTGDNVVYAGGGGGGSGTRAIGGAGGLGGGGTGQALNNNTDGEPGTDGLGGGGGGGSGSFANGNGGNGGSGCVVLRFSPSSFVSIDKLYYRVSDRRLVVEFIGLEDPTANIDLYWTDSDYTSDYSGWTKVPSVGTCADARAAVTVDASARYLVFAVGSSHANPLAVSNLPNESEEIPEITVAVTIAQIPGGLQVQTCVKDVGFDASSLAASFGVRAKGLCDPSEIPLAPIATDWQKGTAWTYDVTGLVRGETYTVRLHLQNDRGEAKDVFAEGRVEADGSNFSYTGDSSVTEFADGRTAIALTSSGTLTLSSAATLYDLLVVGGGGGGGGNVGGGGGAGGVVMKSGLNALIAAGPYEVVIGEGGEGGSSGGGRGGVGGDTSVALGTIAETAPGGGGGATYGNGAGLDGGCGGGGSHGGAGGSATFDDEAAGHFGKAGGKGGTTQGDGGGGATQVGSGSVGSKPGAGGNGISCNFFTGGDAVLYAGGGGGGGTSKAIGGAGGLGGGGAGQALNGNKDGEPGTDGLGGGGGGGSGLFANGSGGKGGSGCVVLRFSSSAFVCLDKLYYRESTRRLVVEFIGLEDPTANIDFYWTDSDYTSDYSGWTKVPSVGTCADARAAVTVDASARYLVFAVGSVYSRPLAVSNLPNESEPVGVEARMVLVQIPGGMQIQVNIEDAGFEASLLAASFGVRAGADDPSTIPLVPIASDWQEGTAWTNDVTGLVRGETYSVRVRLENDQGDVKELLSTCTLSDFPALSYVQRGIIAQWDGFENAGPFAYDAAAKSWIDLCGNSTPFAGDALSVERGAALVSDSALTATCSKLREGVYGAVTVECCGFATRYDPDGSIQDIFDCGAGCALFYKLGSFGVKYVKNGASGDTACDGGDTSDTFSVSPHAITNHNTWALSQTNNARKVYLGGTLGDFNNGSKGWNPGKQTYTQSVVLGCPGGGVDMKYHAVRIYDRQLSDAEVAYNAAIDRIRFEGASYPVEMAKLEPFGYRWNVEKQQTEILITATGTGGFFEQDAIWCGIGEPVTFVFTSTQKGCRKTVWSGYEKENLVKRRNRTATFVFTEPHTVSATAVPGGDGMAVIVR